MLQGCGPFSVKSFLSEHNSEQQILAHLYLISVCACAGQSIMQLSTLQFQHKEYAKWQMTGWLMYIENHHLVIHIIMIMY